MSASVEVRSPCRTYGDAGLGADQATWLYAIARSLDQADLTDLQGIGGGHIRALRSGPLTAVVESVDSAAFSADKLQARLSDPVELEAIARRHHDVAGAVAALGPALPLRLATVYLGDDRVRRLLAERRDEFCQTLSWLAHRSECGIKAWADPDMLRSGAGANGRTGAAQPSAPADQSGTAYLSRRRAELAARAEGQQLAARCGRDIHAALSRLAVASHLHPLHDAGEAADAGLHVLNAAYLVDSASLPDFAASARAVAAEAGALRVVVTGPWPAYSFADGPAA